MNYPKKIQELINKQGIRLDIGCGQSKMPGFIGLDNRPLKGIDIVWDVEKFPWPLPDESCQILMASHLAEHIKPTGLPIQLIDLIALLVAKGILTKKEVRENIGEVTTNPIFMRFMDECWRILKVGGQFMLAFPYANSTGYQQDPSHQNEINERTWEYFDPEAKWSKGRLYHIYEPKPWKIDLSVYQTEGNMEIVLIKRADDQKYHAYTQFKGKAKS